MEETIVPPYRFKVYDLLVLPPSFPYGGMVCEWFIALCSHMLTYILTGKCMLDVLNSECGIDVYVLPESN